MPDRKEFLQTMGRLACAAVFLPGAAASLQSCKSIPRVVGQDYSEGVKVGVDKLEMTETAGVVVEHESLPGAVFVSGEKGQRSAVLLICTHKKCAVRPTSRLLVCPCHGSEFSFTGEVLESPAERPLFSYSTIEDEKYVYIITK